jgi:uracil-DNA glycosylase
LRKGLFSAASAAPLKGHTSFVPLCGACKLHERCESPKMPVHGEGRRKVLIIGEGPGKDEDAQGRPFVGRAGQRLRRALRNVGVDLDRDCWATNAIVCRSWERNGANRDGRANLAPTPEQVNYCRPNVLKAIHTLRPEIIVLLGKWAIQSVIGHLWREGPGDVERWVGWRIPCQRTDAWICPTYHPSHVMRREEGEFGQEDDPVLSKLFEHHIGRAFAKKRRPWDGRERPNPKIEIEYSPDAAARVVESLVGHQRPVAFDLECDRIKPDSHDSRIVCCAVSDGARVVVFPWHGAVVPAMKSLLVSDVPKIGWNFKYEARWIHAKLGVWVNNWVWDGNLAAHILDNRSSITSLKFQAFVVLGQPPWDEVVSPFLRSKPDEDRSHGGNAVNRIKECDLAALMRYCAWDAYLEWKMWKVQSKQLGISLTGGC